MKSEREIIQYIKELTGTTEDKLKTIIMENSFDTADKVYTAWLIGKRGL